jgi:predicted MFS family arabinose efflux permease
MIAPLLPRLAGDLKVGGATAGQLAPIFAPTYAFSSPILTAHSGSLKPSARPLDDRFRLGQRVRLRREGLLMLIAARILLAVAAGLHAPNVKALAGAQG